MAAPNLKGRPRGRKRRGFGREWSFETDSNDSEEHAAYVPKPEKRLPLGLQKRSPAQNYLYYHPPEKVCEMGFLLLVRQKIIFDVIGVLESPKYVYCFIGNRNRMSSLIQAGPFSDG